MAEVAEEYRSSLSELSFNSKPHINMLTMIAEENIKHAPLIVQTIVDHINSVPPDMKLPSMYLVDSIIKNVGKIYIALFSKHLVSLFISVFEQVDENIRSLLYKLRATWKGIFPNPLLLRLDKSVVLLDPAWPIIAQNPPSKNIHVNPKFLDTPTTPQLPKKEESPPVTPQSALLQEANEIKKKQLEVLKVLQAKKQQLLELQKKAGTAPPSTEPVGVEKSLNLRDPRINKKSSETVSDATPLQSVVVIPKGSHALTNKRNDESSQEQEEHSMSPEPKKPKLSTVESDIKKDIKNKLINPSVGIKNNLKSNVYHHAISNTHASENQMIVVNSENKIKNKKRTLSPNSSHLEIKMDKKLPVSSFETKQDSNNSVQKINLNNDVPTKSKYKKRNTRNHFMSNKNRNILHKDNKNHYNEGTMKSMDRSYKNSRLHSPSPPLLFGNEDKDYRTLVHSEVDSDDRGFNEPSYVKRPPVPDVKSFKLDNKEWKVYFANDRSFAVMDDNIPRELSFEGPPKLVFIEGLPQPIELGFGGQVAKFEMDGKWHSIKFGTPSREIYINNYPYEAQFGGPPFPVILDNGRVHRIHISGPPPQVIVSKTPAYELYEKFCETNQEFLSRYDNQSSVNHENKIMSSAHDVDMRVINGRVSSTFFNFPVEKVNDVDWQRMPVGDSQVNEWNAPKNSFETFKDVNPNFIPPRTYTEEVPDWANRSLPIPDLSHSTLVPPPLPPKQFINRFPGIRPPCTTFTSTCSTASMPIQQFSTSDSFNSVPTSNIRPFSQPSSMITQPNKATEYPPTTQFNKLQFSNTPRLTPPPLPPFLNPVSSCNALLPAPPVSKETTLISMPLVSSTVAPPPIQVTAPSILPPVSSALPAPTVNVDLFLEKLVAAGIIGKKTESSTPPPDSTTEPEKTEVKEEEVIKEEPIPEIVFESKCLKEYHPGVINALHNGSQCATCGMRFKEIQSEQYSRHLDWHFRMNRREKDGAKKPFSRRLYYEVKDWIEFKEFEDVDERAPSYFELQANDEQADENLPENICSVPSTECDTETCSVCGEQFQLFWVEEEEEWHLKHAVKHDGQVYHPACYEDFKKASESAKDELETSTCSKEEVDESEEKAENPDSDESEEKAENPDSEVTESEAKDEESDVKEEPQDIEPGDVVKEEPMEIPVSEEEKANVVEQESETISVKPESETVCVQPETVIIKTEPVDDQPLKTEEVKIESGPSSPGEKVPVKSEEEEEEIEFRPPTPDPRFEVLAPVSRGTELSALCTIM